MVAADYVAAGAWGFVAFVQFVLLLLAWSGRPRYPKEEKQMALLDELEAHHEMPGPQTIPARVAEQIAPYRTPLGKSVDAWARHTRKTLADIAEGDSASGSVGGGRGV